jgi:hypothetical protein
MFKPYLVRCACGNLTNKQYMKTHGACKRCSTPLDARDRDVPTREERILEHGYQAYAREEGHYE